MPKIFEYFGFIFYFYSNEHTAEEFIRKYHKNIIEKWVKFFVLKQSVRSTSIKKKL